MNHRAFTLVEVLFAVVLLSLVVTVCVPYMRALSQDTDSADLSAFAAAVDEELYKLQLSQSDAPTLDQIREAVFSIGGRCEPANEVDPKIKGRWITITDGTHTILRWAYVPDEELENNESQAVTP